MLDTWSCLYSWIRYNEKSVSLLDNVKLFCSDFQPLPYLISEENFEIFRKKLAQINNYLDLPSNVLFVLREFQTFRG